MGTLRNLANLMASLVAQSGGAQRTLGRLRYFELLLLDKLDDKLPDLPVVINRSSNGTMKTTIHFVGNSHAHSFTESDLSNFGVGNQTKFLWDSISLGPLSSIDLMERKWSLFLKLIDKEFIQSGDSVIFPFGEAECRWYALKNIEPENRNGLAENDIPSLLDPFLNASFEVYKRTAELGFTVYLWSGHASKGISPREDPDIPVSSNADFRMKMCQYWRVRTKEHSDESGYLFLDFLPVMLINDGAEIENFLVDEVHLDSKIASGFILSNLINLKNEK